MHSIYTRLTQVALKDKVITSDEAAVLDSVLKNIDDYNTVLLEALDDDIITNEEKENLVATRMKIWDEAYQVVMNDSTLTTDELELLQTLIVILQKLEKMET